MMRWVIVCYTLLLLQGSLCAQISPGPGDAILELNAVDETLTLYANQAPCGNDPTCLGVLQGTLTSPMQHLLSGSGPLGIVLALMSSSTAEEYVEVSFLSHTVVDGVFDLSSLYNFNLGVDPGISYSADGWDRFTANVVIVSSLCDFNNDRRCDVADLNLMYATGDLVAGVPTSHGDVFDLNDDLVVDNIDIDRWLQESGSENGYNSAYRRGDVDGIGNVFPAGRGVDITDFNLLSANFDPIGSNGIANTWNVGNFDGDSDVDITDFNFLSSNFSAAGYSGHQVPEPSAFGLIGMVFLAAPCFLRRKLVSVGC